MLSGDNSILQRATVAKENTEMGQEKEIIAIAYNTVVSNKTSKGDFTAVTDTELDTQLNFNNVDAKAKGNPIKVTFNSSKREYTISSKGIITYAGIKNGNTSKKVGDLEVGDYVNYGEKLTVKTYQTNAEETGGYPSQTFKTDNQMLWRVMNKKDNGNVEIVAVSNMLGKNYQDEDMGLYLSGENGFINAENVLNNMCRELYSSSSYGTGRSIKVEDINQLANFNPSTSEWGETGEKNAYGVTQSLTWGRVWVEESNIFKQASSDNPVDVKDEHYYYNLPSDMPLYSTLYQNGEQYWLASRCVNLNGSTNEWYIPYDFHIRFVGNGRTRSGDIQGVMDYNDYEMTMGGIHYYYPSTLAVRPVVELESDVEIQESDTKDGKSETNAYLLN